MSAATPAPAFARHTPGPWKAGEYGAVYGGGVIRSSSGWAQPTLARVTLYHGPDAQEPNARLIAAAPEMLAALHIARLNARHTPIDPENRPGGCWTTCPACVIEAAIAKAEGRPAPPTQISPPSAPSTAATPRYQPIRKARHGRA